jgi:hypothetical protein
MFCLDIMNSLLLTVYGVWQMMGHNSQRTNKTLSVGQINTPKQAWQADISAMEHFLSLSPYADESELKLLASTELQQVPTEELRKYGILPFLLDVLQNGQLVDPPYAPGAKWGKFLPEIHGLQRISWTTTWAEKGSLQLHSFENGLADPRLVWEVPFDNGVYSPMAVVIDIDNDGKLEVAISVWYGVVVYDIVTGQEKYRCMYRKELGRQYGFFGAYTDPSGKSYIVVVGDFAGHIGSLAVEDGELKNIWVHQFDTESIQGIDRRQTINTIGPDPIGDFDGDGHGEILMNLFNNTSDGCWHILAYDLETGEHKLDIPDMFLKGHADVDGDDIDELLVQKCEGRPVGTNGEISICKWDKAIWSHPYARWSVMTLPELPLTRMTGAMRGTETPVKSSLKNQKGQIVFFTAPDVVERLYSLRIYPDLSTETLWEIESVPETYIDAAGAFNEETLIRVRAMNDTDLTLRSKGVQIKPLGKSKLFRDAPQPIVIKDKEGKSLIAVADPLDHVSLWGVESEDNLSPKMLWSKPGHAMTTNVPSMLGLIAGDIDLDGYDEILCVQETPQGYSSIVALGLDSSERWHYDFPEFGGRAPIWNETGTTFWALGHFTDKKRLDVLVSNRRSIMHSDETVVINPQDNSVIWHRDVLEVREPWTDAQWKHTRGYGGGVPALADFDGDGLDDITLCYPAEYSVIKGNNGEQYALDVTGPLRGTNNFWVIGGYPLVADLNGDGKPETLWTSQPIIIAFFHEGIKTDILWRTEPNDGATGLPALGDTDGDGQLEIGLPGFKDGFRCLDPATGQILWTVSPQGDGASNCVSADINGDGIEEFIYANGAKLLAVAKRDDEVMIFWQIDLPASIQNIVIDDIDGDGNAEILAGGRDGVLYCIK